MKFLCVDCDRQMEFEDRTVPGDGTLAAVFRCPACKRSTAMLANPMETQLVSSSGRDDAFAESTETPAGPVQWSVEAVERLNHVPTFVRGMVKKIYNEYAKEHGLAEMTPDLMDRARSDLGLEDM